MTDMENYITFPDNGEAGHEEVIFNNHRWAGVISAMSLSLNIRLSSGPVLRHLLNSWTIQGVHNTHTHTHCYLSLVVSHSPPQQSEFHWTHCQKHLRSCAQNLTDQNRICEAAKILFQTKDHLTTAYLPMMTSSSPRQCGYRMTHCSSSAYSYIAIPTSVII